MVRVRSCFGNGQGKWSATGRIGRMVNLRSTTTRQSLLGATMLNYGVLLFSLLFACKKSGPHDETIELTGLKRGKGTITATVPAGWKLAYRAGNKPGDYYQAAFEPDDSNGLSQVAVELVDGDPPPTSLDDLVAAVGAKFTVLDKETTSSGFGVTFKKGPKDLFLYYAKVGSQSFVCKPADIGYEPKYFEQCKKVCASLR